MSRRRDKEKDFNEEHPSYNRFVNATYPLPSSRGDGDHARDDVSIEHGKRRTKSITAKRRPSFDDILAATQQQAKPLSSSASTRAPHPPSQPDVYGRPNSLRSLYDVAPKTTSRKPRHHHERNDKKYKSTSDILEPTSRALLEYASGLEVDKEKLTEELEAMKIRLAEEAERQEEDALAFRDEACAAIETLQTELDRTTKLLQDQLESHGRRLLEARQQSENKMTETKAQHETRLAESTKRVEQLESELTNALKRLEDSERKSIESSKTFFSLRSQLDEMTEKLGAEMVSHENFSKEAALLAADREARLVDSNHQISLLETRLVDSSHQITNLETRLAESLNLNAETKRLCADLESKLLDAKEQHSKQHEGSAMAFQESLSLTQTLNRELESRRAVAQALAESLEMRLESAEKRADEAEKAMDIAIANAEQLKVLLQATHHQPRPARSASVLEQNPITTITATTETEEVEELPSTVSEDSELPQRPSTKNDEKPTVRRDSNGGTSSSSTESAVSSNNNETGEHEYWEAAPGITKSTSTAIPPIPEEEGEPNQSIVAPPTIVLEPKKNVLFKLWLFMFMACLAIFYTILVGCLAVYVTSAARSNSGVGFMDLSRLKTWIWSLIFSDIAPPV